MRGWHLLPELGVVWIPRDVCEARVFTVTLTWLKRGWAFTWKGKVIHKRHLNESTCGYCFQPLAGPSQGSVTGCPPD